MFSTGKVSFHYKNEPPTAPKAYIGMEFSGLTGRKRIMGLNNYRGISLQHKTVKDMIWEIPDHWSLEDAATVPTAYATVGQLTLKSKTRVRNFLHSFFINMSLEYLNITFPVEL